MSHTIITLNIGLNDRFGRTLDTSAVLRRVEYHIVNLTLTAGQVHHWVIPADRNGGEEACLVVQFGLVRDRSTTVAKWVHDLAVKADQKCIAWVLDTLGAGNRVDSQEVGLSGPNTADYGHTFNAQYFWSVQTNDGVADIQQARFGYIL